MNDSWIITGANTQMHGVYGGHDIAIADGLISEVATPEMRPFDASGLIAMPLLRGGRPLLRGDGLYCEGVACIAAWVASVVTGGGPRGRDRDCCDLGTSEHLEVRTFWRRSEVVGQVRGPIGTNSNRPREDSPLLLCLPLSALFTSKG